MVPAVELRYLTPRVAGSRRRRGTEAAGVCWRGNGGQFIQFSFAAAHLSQSLGQTQKCGQYRIVVWVGLRRRYSIGTRRRSGNTRTQRVIAIWLWVVEAGNESGRVVTCCLAACLGWLLRCWCLFTTTELSCVACGRRRRKTRTNTVTFLWGWAEGFSNYY